jgi:8-oxo-dGTP diphosphatase
VLLDVWRVERFTGTPHGREGQAIGWMPIERLDAVAFPAANRPIIAALQLPDLYLITPEPAQDHNDFLQRLACCLQQGVRLVQFRAASLDGQQYRELARQVVALCHERGAQVLLNADPALVPQLQADGVHLNSRRLAQLFERPLPAGIKVAASCHSFRELKRAQTIDADFAVLSPVKATASHPGGEPLGWRRFAQWTDYAAMPVYALGGLNRADQEDAFGHGAQGIAAIRGLWEADR